MSSNVTCGNCRIKLNHQLHLICDDPICKSNHVCICPNCFFSGVEFDQHLNSHPYIVQDESLMPLYTMDWTQYEELALIQGVKRFGLGNWQDVAEHVRTKNRYECEYHYWTYYVDAISIKLWNDNLEPEDVLNYSKENNLSIDEAIEQLKINKMNEINNIDANDNAISSNTDLNTNPKVNDQQENISNSTKGKISTNQTKNKPKKCLLLDTELSDEDLIKLLQPILPETPLKDDLASKTISKGNVNKDDRGIFIHTLKKNGIPTFICHQKDMPIPQHSMSDPEGKDPDAYAGREIDFISYRNDFSVDWNNGFEEYIAEMSIRQDENPELKKLKIEMLRVYDHILIERDLRKDFIFERDLLDYEKLQIERKKILFQKLKKPYIPFARFVCPKSMEEFSNLLQKQTDIRRKIRKLKDYRKNGIKKNVEIEQYESELSKRRQDSKKRKNDYYLEEKRKRKRQEERMALLNSGQPIVEDETFELLTEKEQELCYALEIQPAQYIIIKEVIMRESSKLGYLSESTLKYLFPNEDENVIKDCASFLAESFSVNIVL